VDAGGDATVEGAAATEVAAKVRGGVGCSATTEDWTRRSVATKGLAAGGGGRTKAC
jgi:hypothetical protein